MRTDRLHRRLQFAATGILLSLVFASAACADMVVLHRFTGGSDGAIPQAGLLKDAAGNLYGTTEYGGGSSNCSSGCGTAFKLAPDGTETILHVFAGGSDGANPVAELVADSAGNLWGTTQSGGLGFGTVFKIASDGTESVVYSFRGGSDDGANPEAPLLIGHDGNLYGTTAHGGHARFYGPCETTGCGTVFQLTPNGEETVLHVFWGGEKDGGVPTAGLIADQEGNLLGTTFHYGSHPCSWRFRACGIVFRLAPDGSEAILHVFHGGEVDGGGPNGIITDDAGNFYGTTQTGGITFGRGNCTNRHRGCGIAFKLAPDGSATVLAHFPNRERTPAGTLVSDSSGNLYGTTSGSTSQEHSFGSVFKLAPDGTLTRLHEFKNEKHGWSPAGGLVKLHGRLYGTTRYGGDGTCNVVGIVGCGTVYSVAFK